MRAIGLKPVVVGFVVTQVLAQNIRAQQAPDVSQLVLPGGPVQTNLTPRIFGLGGDIQVVVQLVDAPLAVANGKNAKHVGGKLSPAQQRDYLVQLGQKQDTLLAQIRNLRGRDLGKLSKALNAVVVTIAASQVPAVAALPGVRTVRQLHDYQLDLSETVPYIGATAVQNVGFNGAGVWVAVLQLLTGRRQPIRGTQRRTVFFLQPRWSAASISSVNGGRPGRLRRTQIRSIADRARLPLPVREDTEPMSPISLPAMTAFRIRVLRRAPCSMQSRFAAQSRPVAADWHCCKEWSSPSTLTAMAIFPMRWT